MIKLLKLYFFAIVLIGITFQCIKKDKVLKADLVVGEQVACRNGFVHKMTDGYILAENDTVIVSSDSKVKLMFGDGVIYVNNNSKLRIGSMTRQNGSYRLKLYLLEGELYFTSNEQRRNPDSFVFIGHGVTATANTGSVNIKSDREQLTIVQISGSTLLTSIDTEERLINSCSRLEIRGLNRSRVEPVSQSDVSNLKNWVGNTTITSALSQSGCTAQSTIVRNLPPEWVRSPYEVYMAGEMVIDTVQAVDPENGEVTYQLLSGPQGMTLDEKSGEIQFKPISSGTANVSIKAIDSDSQSTVLDHFITISSMPAVVLNAPRMVSPGEYFSINASLPKNLAKQASGYLYRFDCNGDGVFDYPESERFGKRSVVKNCVFSQEGTYLLKVEMKDSEGKTVSATRKILVNRRPEASLTITPVVGTTETEFLLDASGCSDTRDAPEELMVRFDTDNDGRWDIPFSTGFIAEKRTKYSWSEAGKFRVIVQVIDKQGMTDTASAEVTVGRGIKIDYITCPDTIHVGDSIRIECKYTPSEFAVKTFKWSLDSDTAFEISTDKPVYNHVFRKEGAVDIRCRIIDEKGFAATQHKKVIIVNRGCSVNAGGPYKTNVNTPVVLEGVAKDPDNKILKYYWDFDGDRIPDWNSEQNGKTTHIFKKSGKKKVFFSVMTDDSLKFFDSTFVEVINEAPVADAGEDIVSRSGKKVKLNGIGQDKDGNIVEYRWDFDNDGKIDWSSADNGMTETTFKSYTTAVFSVMDSDSSISYDSIRIIICPDDMQTIESEKFCIDTYEYPNKKGETPILNVTYTQARESCQNQGKRLCTPQEWERACRNDKEKNSYPYGKNYLLEKCNTLGNPVMKNKVSESGFFYDCRGDAGVFDMSGNAAEWTESEGGEPYVYGGSWQSGENESTCGSKFQLQGGGKYFYVGFRCCK